MLQAKTRSVVRSSMDASLAHNHLSDAKFGMEPKTFSEVSASFIGLIHHPAMAAPCQHGVIAEPALSQSTKSLRDSLRRRPACLSRFE
jgi:hypothetical protein